MSTAMKRATAKAPAPKGKVAAAPAKKAAPKAKVAAPKAKSVATKQVSARKVPGVSPLRGMPLDAWLAAKAKGWQAAVIERVIAVVSEAAPSSACSIKWGRPVFEEAGPFLWVQPAKAHVTVGFWRGSELSDPRKLLETGGKMGHFKLHSETDLDVKVLAAWVKQAVKLNREKGSPATRG